MVLWYLMCLWPLIFLSDPGAQRVHVSQFWHVWIPIIMPDIIEYSLLKTFFSNYFCPYLITFGSFQAWFSLWPRKSLKWWLLFYLHYPGCFLENLTLYLWFILQGMWVSYLQEALGLRLHLYFHQHLVVPDFEKILILIKDHHLNPNDI